MPRITEKTRETVRTLLRMSPQSKASLAVPETEQFKANAERWNWTQGDLFDALDELVVDDEVEEYEDGKDAAGNPVLMYRLLSREEQAQ